MIIVLEGGLGSGKTILMVRYLVKDYMSGRIIYYNGGLKKIKYEKINIGKILELHKNKFNLKDCTIGIDEITVFADCRISGSKLNRAISYFILQSRKRNVDIYFTTQNVNMIDKRLNQYTDIHILCEKIYDHDGNTIEGRRKYTIIDTRDWYKPHITRFVLDITKYYEFYDTNEVILPLDLEEVKENEAD